MITPDMEIAAVAIARGIERRCSRAERRLGERSPRPRPSLSVTVVIDITSRPTFDPAPVGHAGAGARYAA